MSRAEQATAPIVFHGEGPMWDPAGGRLFIVDMLAGAVVEPFSPQPTARHEVGTVAAALRPRRDGGFVVATEHAFLLTDELLRPVAEPVEVFDDPAIRMNDGGCDPQGRFYCGTMAYAETPGAGTLYRLDPGLGVTTVLSGVTISNGLQWSADGALVYYNDTPTGRIDVFDFDPSDGTLHDRRPFAVIEEGVGLPDGLTVDGEGGVWTALWGGGAVRRYDAEGVLSEVVEVPGVSHVTACAFGGESLETLYITTSRLGLPEDAEPQAGAVFTHSPSVAGRPLHSFAG